MGKRIKSCFYIPEIVAFLILVIFTQCTGDNSLAFTIGSNFIRQQTSVVVVDSFTVGMSTFVLDSFSTSSPKRLLAGGYSDEYFGKTTASAYFQIGIPDSAGINSNSVFDSLIIRLHYSGSYYGDTLQPLTLFVHRINNTMDEPDDKYFYNKTSFDFDSVPLGKLTFRPHPKRDANIKIRLNDAFGKQLMKLLIDESNEIAGNSAFTEYLKGLVLKCGENSQTILSFAAADSMIDLVLFTHYTSEERKDINYKFPLYTGGKYFNHIDVDRTGTDIEGLKTRKDKILSTNTGNKTFLQAGTGVLTRVDFPSLYKIREIESRYIYYRAELILKPLPKSNKQVPFPKQLVLFTTNKFNEVVSQVTDSKSNAVVSESVFDEIYNEENYYKFDITNFLNNTLSSAYLDGENGLIIGFQENDFKSTLDRVVFDGRLADMYRPVLKMYFIFYE